jgi:hypothetical protein
MRSFLLAAAVAGLAAAAPARAADVDKYLPDDAGFYVHITTKNFLAAPVIRTAIPMAFDKYGDQILQFLPLMKAFNPNAPDIPEEQFKKGLSELKKPETIAKGFDAAKEFGPEIIVAGDPDAGGPDKFVVLVKASPVVTPEVVQGFVPMIQATGQLKVKTSKVGNATVYELTAPQQPQPFYASVPEAGVILLGASKEAVEGAAKAAGGKISAELKGLIGKRTAKDFVFVAGVKGKGDAKETIVGSLVLDKDISGSLTGTFATPEEAKQKADELSKQVEQMVDGLKGLLGDQANAFKPQLDAMKAPASGKTVSFKGTVPGGVVEKLLAKDKDK